MLVCLFSSHTFPQITFFGNNTVWVDPATQTVLSKRVGICSTVRKGPKRNLEKYCQDYYPKMGHSSTGTIWIRSNSNYQTCPVFEWYLSGVQIVFPIMVQYSNHSLNYGPLGNQTFFYHLNTVGIWNPTIWNPDFLKVGFQMVGL